jgi:iron complex transport system substrate-binding protein
MTKRFMACLFIAAIMLTGLVGCQGNPATPALSQKDFTDQAGRVIHLDKIPQRIISLAPSNTEILFAIGLGDKVVGDTDYCDYPPEAKEKAKIGGFWTPDIEKIVSLNPDLVVAQANHVAEVIPQLEKYGIPAVVLDPKSLDEILQAITLAGEITGNTGESSKVVKDLQSRIDRVTKKTKDLAESAKPKVFFITWHDPLITVGSVNFIEDLIYKAGGVNIFHNLEGSPTVSLEDVVQANPDVIIAGTSMGDGGDNTLQFVRTESRLAGTNARVNDRVYSILFDIAGRPGPRIVDGLEAFLADIHPELRDQPN